MNKFNNGLKIVKILIMIYAILLFGSFLLGKVNISVILLCLSPIFMMGILFGFYTKLKKDRENIIANTPKKRFKYLDSFYYIRKFIISDKLQTRYFVFHIIEDVDTGRIYAIDANSTNAYLSAINGDAKIVKNDGKLMNLIDVSFGDEGDFWLVQENNDFYINDGENIKFNYHSEEHIINVDNELHHFNEEYDKSLLDKATFIGAFAEFDM